MSMIVLVVQIVASVVAGATVIVLLHIAEKWMSR